MSFMFWKGHIISDEWMGMGINISTHVISMIISVIVVEAGENFIIIYVRMFIAYLAK